jgi:hypothetical protein
MRVTPGLLAILESRAADGDAETLNTRTHTVGRDTTRRNADRSHMVRALRAATALVAVRVPRASRRACAGASTCQAELMLMMIPRAAVPLR